MIFNNYIINDIDALNASPLETEAVSFSVAQFSTRWSACSTMKYLPILFDRSGNKGIALSL